MRLVVGLLSVLALAFAVPAAADRPTPIEFVDVFPDVNPCTDDPMMVTITTRGFEHSHGSRFVFHSERTITTSDGFFGRGTESALDNGQVFRARFADIMKNTSGDRFRARGVFVFDISTETVRVERLELTCLGP
jgi:hypothetical protein